MVDEKKKEAIPRHKKMYKNSPKLARGEDGKMGVTKGEKKAADVNSGTDGVPEHESHALEMGHKHEKEHLELNQKHEKERHMLRSKHMKDMQTGEGKEGGEKEGKKESTGSGEGKEKVEKVEEKKE